MCDGMKLDGFDVEATIMGTPGHAPGSAPVIFPDGDAMVGDILMGGIIGGALWSCKPRFHYFADNIQQAMESLDRHRPARRQCRYPDHFTYERMSCITLPATSVRR